MMLRLFLIASLVMGASHTVARERLCEPFRRWCQSRSSWLGYLVSCPYCASHWVAFAVVPLTGAYYVDVVPLPGHLDLVARWFLSSLLVATIAAYLRVLFYVVDVAQGVMRRLERIEDRELRERGD
jgi:hypothetical protein